MLRGLYCIPNYRFGFLLASDRNGLGCGYSHNIIDNHRGNHGIWDYGILLEI